MLPHKSVASPAAVVPRAWNGFLFSAHHNIVGGLQIWSSHLAMACCALIESGFEAQKITRKRPLIDDNESTTREIVAPAQPEHNVSRAKDRDLFIKRHALSQRITRTGVSHICMLLL